MVPFRLTTPTRVNPEILDFCERLSPGQMPHYVPVQSSGPAGYCNVNVSNSIAKRGGDLVEGWMIWFAEGQMIEAEGHCVWRNQEGSLIDVTAKPDGEVAILFLLAKGLWTGNRCLPNRQQALQDNQLTRAVIVKAKFIESLRERHWDGHGSTIPQEEYLHAEQLFEAIVFGVEPYSPCPCRSGKKFRFCCGVPRGAPWSNFQ